MLFGEKTCLGPMLPTDAPIIFKWRNSLEVMHLDGLYRPISQAIFDEWFHTIGRDSSRVVFSIRKKDGLDFLGYVQIVDIHPVYRSAEVGIMIGELANRGKGYGQDALRLCVQFCWNELNLQRLSLKIIGENKHAIHTYEKAGFVHEGVLRRAIYVNGAFTDTTLMALLRT
ncbi:MAG: GNAT family N-acetyltransferase [Thiobacillaceae bacterium]